MDKENILSILDALNIGLVQIGSRNIQCQCPLARCEEVHRGQKRRASMGISISPDGISLVNCLSCKFGGTLLYTISKLSKERGADYSQIINKVSLIEGQDPEFLLKQVPPYFESITAKTDIIIDEEEIAPMIGKTHKYALDRGLEIETIRTWGGGYDLYRKRILFPVRNIRGQLVGAVGRTINGHRIKYFNYFDFNKSRYLFGEHFVKGGSLIIVEGLLDTISVWQALQKENALEEFSVVGLLGSSPSKKQLDKIKKLSRDVVLFLDNDAAGKLGTEIMKKALWKSVLLTAVEYPSEDISDPDDAVRRGISISQLARNAPIAVV